MPFKLDAGALLQWERALGRNLVTENGKRRTYEEFTDLDIADLRLLNAAPVMQCALVLHWLAGEHGLQNAKMFVYEVLHEGMDRRTWCSDGFRPMN